MNLIVDAGNTVLKAAVADGLILGKTYRYQGEKKIEYIRDLSQKIYPSVLVVCSAKPLEDSDIDLLKPCAAKLVIIDPVRKEAFSSLNVPDYLTPDALSCILASQNMFKGKAVSVFDFGTTITSTFMSAEGNFLGSTISPGCTTRFRSISRYARNLPLLMENEENSVTGTSLEASIRSGVVGGIMFEVEGLISAHPENVVIFTGGDAIYFAKRTKSSIFVICNLVLMGLAIIAQNEIEE